MEKTKVTKKDFYNEIISVFEGSESSMNAEDVIAFCKKEIDALQKKAEKAKERAAEKKAEQDELFETVKNALSADEFETIADITAKINDEDVTTYKVTYRLNALVKAGLAEKQEISVDKRKLMGYKAV